MAVPTDSPSGNSLGIPAATFLVSSLTIVVDLDSPFVSPQEDVEQFMKEQGPEAEAGIVIKRLDEQHSKYRFMELNLTGKKRRLKKQVPDMRASLDVLSLLRARRAAGQELQTHFLLSDEVYMQAAVPAVDHVNLWLGANVMLSYPVDEAESLLRRNLLTAEKNLSQIDVDLDYLRDQITTTEVNMARVYNWDVKRRTNDNKKETQ